MSLIITVPAGCLSETIIQMQCKAPQEDVNYTFCLGNRLYPYEIIKNVVIQPATIENDENPVTGKLVSIMGQIFIASISGGTINTRYGIRFIVTTNSGEIREFDTSLLVAPAGVIDNSSVPPIAIGNTGAAGTVTIGNTTTGNAGDPAIVTNVGTDSAAILDFVIPMGAEGSKGDKGDPGERGEAGNAATISVNATTTGEPGTNAKVENAGTNTAAILNFTIPRGDKGEVGETGTSYVNDGTVDLDVKTIKSDGDKLVSDGNGTLTFYGLKSSDGSSLTYNDTAKQLNVRNFFVQDKFSATNLIASNITYNVLTFDSTSGGQGDVFYSMLAGSLTMGAAQKLKALFSNKNLKDDAVPSLIFGQIQGFIPQGEIWDGSSTLPAARMLYVTNDGSLRLANGLDPETAVTPTDYDYIITVGQNNVAAIKNSKTKTVTGAAYSLLDNTQVTTSSLGEGVIAYNTTTKLPTLWTGSAWEDIDAKGEKGDKGDTGDAGAAATVTVGTTTTGEAGSQASVTNSGTTSAAILDFTIPKGEKGDAGAAGAKGDTGATGEAGKDGAAATIAVGKTTTGDAGTDASVTNSGTSSAATFDFTIPKGEKGDKGDTGAAGTSYVNDGTVALNVKTISSDGGKITSDGNGIFKTLGYALSDYSGITTTSLAAGVLAYNTTSNLPTCWNGTAWVDLTAASSLSYVDPDQKENVDTKMLKVGAQSYDTTTKKPCWWDGTEWKDANGTKI